MSDTNGLTPRSGKVIVGSIPTVGGLHCETTTLGVLLGHAGVELSEPMLFGLGSGLSFIYWDSKHMELPFLGGRVRPFALTQRLTTRLGLALRVQETSSARKAWDQVRASIDGGSPVGLLLDSHDLDYFGSRVHFAGHIVALYGYDDERAYLVDTAQQGGGVSTSLESLASARAARGPMSARHRSFTVEVPEAHTLAEQLVPAILSAITACADEFLEPPIANLGNRGIRTAALRVRSLLDRVADPERDLPVISMLMERGGTGGALFRNLYRDFLTECIELLRGRSEADIVMQGIQHIAGSAKIWTSVAQLIECAGATGNPKHLTEASGQLAAIADIETAAMAALRTLKAPASVSWSSRS